MNNTKEHIEQHQELCNATRTKLKDAGILGPWIHEKDRIEFKHAGMDCLMVRTTSMFHWCGYVGLNPNHKDYGKNYDEIEVNIHGGLTYGETCRGHICHIPQPGDPEHLFWVGFDCYHYLDLSPSSKLYGFLNEKEIYRTEEWVKKETMRLAEQLAGII